MKRCVVCAVELTGRRMKYCSNRCHCAARYKPSPPKASDCQQCGGPLPEKRDPRSLYCSGYCTQKANRTRKAYQRANRERARERDRKRYAEDPNPKKAAVDRWIRANPEKAAEIRRQRRARKANAPSLPFTTEQLAQRLAYLGDACWVCDGRANQIDHVKPLARGGWHALCNLRPTCQSCNASKGADWPYDPTERRASLAATRAA